MITAIVISFLLAFFIPPDKRAALKKSCTDWLYREDPWPLADMLTHELLWSYSDDTLETEHRDEIEQELVHRLAYGSLSLEEEKKVIEALKKKTDY